MVYAEAVSHLHGLAPELAPGKTPRRFDLARMRRLCAVLGNPQDRVPAILIAGTNGKGSTAATLAGILTTAGYRTGLYTSPHLQRINERIQLAHPTLPSEYGATVTAGAPAGADGPLTLTEIPDDLFARFYSLVDDAGEALVRSGDLPLPPSFFERVTATAFLYFVDQQTEIAILEVGLGGRLDATNVVEPLVSIITDIALDHQEYLGNTIAEITREKCGILRPRGTLITLPQLPEANQTIGLIASELEVHAVNAARFVPSPTRTEQTFIQSTSARVDQPSASSDPLDLLPRNRYALSLDDGSELTVDSPLAGQHQQRNIALAIAAAIELRNPTGYKSATTREISNQTRYKIENTALAQGIKDTHWPGRLEFLAPDLLLDVAHNPAGAWTLRSALAALPPERPRTLIFSCLRDKSLAEMARILFPLFDSSDDADPLRRHDHILLAPIVSPRAAAVDDLLAAAHELHIPAHAAPHLAGALAQARQITPAGGLILATGSVYLVGEVRQLALQREAHFGAHAQ